LTQGESLTTHEAVGPSPEQALALYRAQKRLLAQLSSGVPLNEILGTLIGELERFAPNMWGSILLLREGRLRYGAAPSLPAAYNRAADGHPIGEGMGSCGTAAYRRQPVIVADIEQDPLWQNYRDIARRYHLRACWSIPLFAVRDGELLGTFALYHPEPRQPTAYELWLVHEFAELARVAIEHDQLRVSLAETRRRFDDLLDDLDAIAWEGDGEARRFTFVGSRAEQLLGYPQRRWIDEPAFWTTILHEEDREATVRHVVHETGAARDHEAEYRVRAADGRTIWIRDLAYVRSRGPGEPTRAHGVMLNISRQREAEQAREELLQSCLREQDLNRAVLRQLPEAVIVVEPSCGRILTANDQAEQLMRRPLPIAELIQDHAAWRLHPDGRPYQPNELAIVRALTGDERVCDEAGFVRGDGSRCTLALTATPVHDRAGRIIAALVAFSDISARKRRERHQRFLADVGAALVRSLDGDAMARSVAEVAVAELADCCALFAYSEGGLLSCVAAARRDGDGAELRERLAHLAQQPGGAPFALSSVLASGRARLFTTVTPDAFEAGAMRTETLQLVRALGVRSAMAVPIVGRSRVLGAAIYCTTDEERGYDEEDLAVAEELAPRLALAWENARLYVEAQKAIAQREEFLSIAAHELNTPLAGLQLAVQTMALQLEKDELDREGLRQRVRSGERQCKRLGRLVHQLLDVARMNAGRLELSVAELDLVEVLHGVVGRFRDELEAKQIDLALHAPTPVSGRWDRLRVEQVLTNLISNAIKYGRARPISISVAAEGDWAICTVSDHGLGVSPDLQPRLFRPFERGVAAGEYGGLGLGLYISDQIVRAHGGSLGVRSRAGDGASFIVRLPRHPDGTRS
jgi:PAS domain S-box-containing protein